MRLRYYIWKTNKNNNKKHTISPLRKTACNNNTLKEKPLPNYILGQSYFNPKLYQNIGQNKTSFLHNFISSSTAKL